MKALASRMILLDLKLKYFVVLLMTSVCSLLLLGACKKDKIVAEDVIFTSDDVDIERLNQVEILYSDSAQVQVKITAPTLLRHNGQNIKQEFTDGLLVEFFDTYQRPTGKLSAKYGERIEGDYKIVVRDSVVWESNHGEKLDTEELTWDERNKKIFTNKFVTLTRPDEIIFGYGFEADQDFKRSTIRAAQGRIKLNEFKPNE